VHVKEQLMQARLSFELSALQNEILEAVATGTDFGSIADVLCQRAEALAPGAICTIASVDSEGLIHPVAGPSLPQSYGEAIDGIAIGRRSVPAAPPPISVCRLKLLISRRISAGTASLILCSRWG
jgi:GAF domain-containing protein